MNNSPSEGEKSKTTLPDAVNVFNALYKKDPFHRLELVLAEKDVAKAYVDYRMGILSKSGGTRHEGNHFAILKDHFGYLGHDTILPSIIDEVLYRLGQKELSDGAIEDTTERMQRRLDDLHLED